MPIEAIDTMPGFTIGADPEFFILNKQTNEYVGAEHFLPGDKQNPYPVACGAIQVDGMAAEINIDPASCFEEFHDNLTTVMRSVKGFLPRNHSLVAVPSVEFSQAEWDQASDQAKELGCSPDYNAWTGSMNPPPNPEPESRMRCAGGHLHIGWTNDANTASLRHMNNCRDLVKQLDWYLGGWSVPLDPDTNRRKLYGKAGACRIKPYGVEYRVLSNFWLSSTNKRRAVWNRLNQAIWDMRVKFIPDEAQIYQFNDRLIRSIETSELDSAIKSQFHKPLVSL